MKKVIAIDFDGTLFENKWPEIGMPIAPNINRAKNEKANGAVLILWTCREGEKLAEALAACKAVGLEFDYVNENTDELKAEFGTDPRKIAQLVILPIVTPALKLVDKFAKTERGDNGFGSTGR